MDSILKTVRHMIGPSEEYEYFDKDLIVHINAAFARLCTLGVGPTEPFYITDDSATWDDFVTQVSMKNIEQFVVLNVRRDFDPPTNGTLMDALNKQIEKLEFLLNVVAETGY